MKPSSEQIEATALDCFNRAVELPYDMPHEALIAMRRQVDRELEAERLIASSAKIALLKAYSAYLSDVALDQ